MQTYIIKLEGKNRDAVYKADRSASNIRTTHRNFAQQYRKKSFAKMALSRLRNSHGRAFKDAKIFEY